MLRPIDTQILYPQSPQLSNRQQVDNQKATIQQDTFADIMKEETNQKKETIIKTEENQQVKNNKKDSEKKRSKQSKNHPNKKKNLQENKKDEKIQTQSTIDIRI